MAQATPIDRFLAKVEWSDQRYEGTRCLVWTGASNTKGHGQFTPAPGHRDGAYRWLYERWVGPIPVGLQIDHLCRNPPCVNPAHLEPVTPRENTIRGLAPEVTKARHRERTHCIHGHEFTPENTYVKPADNSRRCRICIREAHRRSRLKKKSA